METFIGFAAVVMTTIIALFGALVLQALLLRAAVALMQPATAVRRVPASSTVRSRQLVTHAYAKTR